ncbi:unnamed protein product, partial [Cyprideis torosa]
MAAEVDHGGRSRSWRPKSIMAAEVDHGVRRSNLDRQILTNSERREIGYAVMILCIVIVFFICNSLAFVVNILEKQEAESIKVVVSYLVPISNLLVSVNSSANFVIYCIFGQKFQLLLLRYFRAYIPPCCLPKDAGYSLEESNVNRRLSFRADLASNTGGRKKDDYFASCYNEREAAWRICSDFLCCWSHMSGEKSRDQEENMSGEKSRDQEENMSGEKSRDQEENITSELYVPFPTYLSSIFNPYLSSIFNPYLSSIFNPYLSSIFNPYLSSIFNPYLSSIFNPYLSSIFNPYLSSIFNPYLSSIFNPYLSSIFNPYVHGPSSLFSVDAAPPPQTLQHRLKSLTLVPKICRNIEPTHLSNKAKQPVVQWVFPVFTESQPQHSRHTPDLHGPPEALPLREGTGEHGEVPHSPQQLPPPEPMLQMILPPSQFSSLSTTTEEYLLLSICIFGPFLKCLKNRSKQGLKAKST